MHDITEEEINDYLDDLRDRWNKNIDELKTASNFNIYYESVYSLLLVELKYLIDLITYSNLDNKIIDKLLFKFSGISFELVSNIQKSYILSTNKKIFLFKNIKKLELPKGLGTVEFFKNK
ncbi:hypothetical protein M0P25_03560 [archaeon]|jgi:hypothetical protein|nr:hypothetical protein [archaeon]